MKKGSGRFDQKKEVRAIARERVGAVKPARAIVPKTRRKKPKHPSARATNSGLNEARKISDRSRLRNDRRRRSRFFLYPLHKP
jgi:hypothetical protein